MRDRFIRFNNWMDRNFDKILVIIALFVLFISFCFLLAPLSSKAEDEHLPSEAVQNDSSSKNNINLISSEDNSEPSNIVEPFSVIHSNIDILKTIGSTKSDARIYVIRDNENNQEYIIVTRQSGGLAITPRVQE